MWDIEYLKINSMDKEVKPATLNQRLTLLGIGGIGLIVLFYILVKPKKS